MTNCNIPWGYHTMTYKEPLYNNKFYLSKCIRKDDGLVSFGIHETKNNHLVTFDYGMIIVEAELYNESDDSKYINKLKDSFDTFLAEKLGYSKELLKLVL